MAKLSALEKKLEVGRAVMVCLPALIRSGSSSTLIGKRADAEHAVLTLQGHVHAGGHGVGHQGRNADAQVHIEAVAQLRGGAGGHLLAGPGHQAVSSARGRVVRNSIRFS